MLLSRASLMLGCLFLTGISIQSAHAASVTETGTLAADNSVYTYNLTVTAATEYLMWTTSYASGGFVPVITVFSSQSGNVVANDGADGTCSGFDKKDATTKMCDDAYIAAFLPAGNYVIDLTEFPNEAIGNLSSGFLFSSDPTATGDVCGTAGGMFLQADVAPCVQRTDAYSLNLTSTPEPATLWLVLPAVVFSLIRLKAARSRRSRLQAF